MVVCIYTSYIDHLLPSLPYYLPYDCGSEAAGSTIYFHQVTIVSNYREVDMHSRIENKTCIRSRHELEVDMH